MSQNLSLNSKTNQQSFGMQKTQIAKQNYWASDDVHRVAMRSPALYQTNIVPQIPRRMLTLNELEQGGVA